MKFKAMVLVLMLGCAAFCLAEVPQAAPAKAPAAAQTVAPQTAEVVTSAAAQEEARPEPKREWTGMLMPILIIVVMIFIFSRSNKKQQQKRQEMLDRIVKGSRVLLNSGVYGKVAEVREKEFLVEIADNVKVLVVKNGVASVEDGENKSGDAR